MNGVIYKIIWWQQSSFNYEYKKVNGKLIRKQLKTARIYTKDDLKIIYNKAMLERQEMQKRLIPFFKKGGFIYDKNVFYDYKLEVLKKGPYSLQLTCLAAFEDTNNEGKIEFMKYIKKTGLLSTLSEGGTGLILVQPYGKIF